MKKFLSFAFALVMVCALAVPALAVPAADTATITGCAFHCTEDGGNGKTSIVGQAKDFGKNATVELLRDSDDPTVWHLVSVNGDKGPFVCATCGSSEWVSFSNKNGVPDGKNIQFSDVPATTQDIIDYYAICQIWNDLVWGNDGYGLTTDYHSQLSQDTIDKMMPVGIAHREKLMAYWNTTDMNVRYLPFSPESADFCQEWSAIIRYREVDGVSLQSVCDELGIDIDAFIAQYDWPAFVARNNLEVAP